MPDDRLTEFEKAMDPTITKFAPKGRAEVSVATLVAQVREQTQATLKLCDEIDRAILASEEHARKAADSLMDMIKRVK